MIGKWGRAAVSALAISAVGLAAGVPVVSVAFAQAGGPMAVVANRTTPPTPAQATADIARIIASAPSIFDGQMVSAAIAAYMEKFASSPAALTIIAQAVANFAAANPQFAIVLATGAEAAVEALQGDAAALLAISEGFAEASGGAVFAAAVANGGTPVGGVPVAQFFVTKTETATIPCSQVSPNSCVGTTP